MFPKSAGSAHCRVHTFQGSSGGSSATYKPPQAIPKGPWGLTPTAAGSKRARTGGSGHGWPCERNWRAAKRFRNGCAWAPIPQCLGPSLGGGAETASDPTHKGWIPRTTLTIPLSLAPPVGTTNVAHRGHRTTTTCGRAGMYETPKHLG